MTTTDFDARAATLHRFRSVLAPSGILCIADLDTDDGTFHGPDVDVHHGFDREALGAMARQSGLATVAFRTAHVMTTAVGDEMRRSPIFLMVAGAS
jgi:hypothetical protein